MKLLRYLAILGTALCGLCFARAQAPVSDAAAARQQPVTNQTTNSAGPKVFIFSGGSFTEFVDALAKYFGTNVTQMLDWPRNEPRIRIPRMRIDGNPRWMGVLKTYNTISEGGDGFLGKWIYSPSFSSEDPPRVQTLVFIPPKPTIPDGELQVHAFPIRGMPAATIEKLREAIQDQARLIQRRVDNDSARGEVNVHEGTGLLVAVGGKTYVELVGTLVDAFNTNFPYPRP
jgi:hypothetical protein